MTTKRKKKPAATQEWYSGYTPHLVPVPGLMVYAQARITELHWHSLGCPCWSIRSLSEGEVVTWAATNVPAHLDLGVAWEPDLPPIYVAAGWCTVGQGVDSWDGVDALCRIIPDARLPVGERGKKYGSCQRPAWTIEPDRLSQLDVSYVGLFDFTGYLLSEGIFDA